MQSDTYSIVFVDFAIRTIQFKSKWEFLDLLWSATFAWVLV